MPPLIKTIIHNKEKIVTVALKTIFVIINMEPMIRTKHSYYEKRGYASIKITCSKI